MLPKELLAKTKIYLGANGIIIMRILKSFPVDSKKSEAVSKMADMAIVEFSYPWHFDSIELHLRDQEKIVIEGSRCIIVMDYNNFFVRHMDDRGIRIMIMRSLFKASMELTGELPAEIEDIICNRKMIKAGFSDDIVYYYFQRKSEARTPIEELQRDVGWLSFCGLDSYNMQLLKKENRYPQTGKLIECLKGELSPERLGHAKRLYLDLVSECR